MPSLQVEPLVDGATYDVHDELAGLLLKTPVWTEATEDSEVPIASESSESDSFPEQAVDDLQLVKGIGPQTAKALRKTGITTFALLIDTPAEQIDKLLDGSLNYITTTTIRDWQANASTLKG